MQGGEAGGHGRSGGGAGAPPPGLCGHAPRSPAAFPTFPHATPARTRRGGTAEGGSGSIPSSAPASALIVGTPLYCIHSCRRAGARGGPDGHRVGLPKRPPGLRPAPGRGALAASDGQRISTATAGSPVAPRRGPPPHAMAACAIKARNLCRDCQAAVSLVPSPCRRAHRDRPPAGSLARAPPRCEGGELCGAEWGGAPPPRRPSSPRVGQRHPATSTAGVCVLIHKTPTHRRPPRSLLLTHHIQIRNVDGARWGWVGHDAVGTQVGSRGGPSPTDAEPPAGRPTYSLYRPKHAARRSVHAPTASSPVSAGCPRAR